MVNSLDKGRNKKEYWAFEDIIVGNQLAEKIKSNTKRILDSQNVMSITTALKILQKDTKIYLERIIKKYDICEDNLNLINDIIEKDQGRRLKDDKFLE